MDLGVLALLSDSFESDQDFSLDILDTAFASVHASALEDPGEEASGPPSAPPDTFMAVRPGSSLVEHQPQVRFPVTL